MTGTSATCLRIQSPTMKSYTNNLMKTPKMPSKPSFGMIASTYLTMRRLKRSQSIMNEWKSNQITRQEEPWLLAPSKTNWLAMVQLALCFSLHLIAERVTWSQTTNHQWFVTRLLSRIFTFWYSLATQRYLKETAMDALWYLIHNLKMMKSRPWS